MPNLPAHVARELGLASPLHNGDRGAAVKRVQEWLSLQGAATAIDGEFRDATERSVTEFQTRAGLSGTGIVDSATWSALVQPLTSALEVRPPSATLASTVLQVAQQHLGQTPKEVGGDNKGPWVRVYCGGNEGPEWRWCAGFVTFILRQACLATGRSMPIAGSYSCDSLAYQAREKSLFVSGKDVASGLVSWGSLGAAQIFLNRRTATDWTHTGFSFDGRDQTFATIEGNTNDDGSHNGYEVCRRTRSLDEKDLIRIPD